MRLTPANVRFRGQTGHSWFHQTTIQLMAATQRIPALGLQWPWKKTNFGNATATASEFLALRKHATDLSGQDFLRGGIVGRREGV
jgi:hypothetical protein